MSRLVFGTWTSHTIGPIHTRPVPGAVDAPVAVSGDILSYSDATSDVPLAIGPFSPGDNVPTRVFAVYASEPPPAGAVPAEWLAQSASQGAVAVPADLPSGGVVTVTVGNIPAEGTSGGFQVLIEYAV